MLIAARINCSVAAYIYYCTVRSSIMARIKLKNPQGEANKSANRWGNLRAKGGVVPTLQSLTCLARVNIKYNLHTVSLLTTSSQQYPSVK